MKVLPKSDGAVGGDAKVDGHNHVRVRDSSSELADVVEDDPGAVTGLGQGEQEEEEEGKEGVEARWPREPHFLRGFRVGRYS